jgi:Zn-dependent peptidase ImmA (M78 family)/transcriptional regulator with XRE-family HTH domain
MRQGVSGFQGARLIQAREGRGMTQSALATLINRRSSTAISRWEKGDQLPEMDALECLERQLNIPASWFLKPLPQYGDKPFFFRSKAAITKSARLVAKTRLEFAQEISMSLQEWVDWPVVDVPCLDPNDYLRITDQDIENLTVDLRKHWKLGLGPISDITLLLENAGVVIAKEEIGYSNMDGVSKWFDIDSRPYVFLATDKANSVRQRFDAAHELAHLVLHRHLTDVEFNARYKEIEHQADTFAGAFLLPSESFSAEISSPSLDTFIALKPRWKTSIGAMLFRTKQMGLISEDYALRLWKNYSARGWRRGEPGDDRIAFEEIRLMPRAINLLLKEGGFDSERLISEVGLFRTDIERLCGLQNGFLLETKNNVVQMKLRHQDKTSPTQVNSANNVVMLDTHRKLE